MRSRSTSVRTSIAPGPYPGATSGIGSSARDDALAPAREPRHDGADRHAERVGGLLVGEPERRRPRRPSRGTASRARAPRRAPRGARRAGPGAAAARGSAGSSASSSGTSGAAPPRGGGRCAVAQHRHQVGQLGAAGQAARAAQEREVDLLHEVLGIGMVAAQRECGGEQPVEMSQRRIGIKPHMGSWAVGSGRGEWGGERPKWGAQLRAGVRGSATRATGPLRPVYGRLRLP